MIYTIISDLSQLDNIYTQDRDCRYARQPLSLISKDIREYIDSTKNEQLRKERLLAYTTLFAFLSHSYGIENAFIERNEYGKPYFKIYKEKLDLEEEKTLKSISIEKTKNDHNKILENLHINLSHSDGLVAVTLSDEGEVGVDIQVDISEEKKEKLATRFFKNITVKSEKIGVKYLYFTIEEEKYKFTQVNPENCDENDAISRWTYAESVLKLDGKGFKNIEKIEKKSKKTRSEGKKIEKNQKKYVFFTTKEK